MKYASWDQYINKVRRILLGAGVTGISQHDINQRTRTKIFKSEDLLNLLNEWEARQWIQSFKVTGLSRHPKTMWRATTKLRDDWSSLIIDGELPTLVQPGVVDWNETA